MSAERPRAGRFRNGESIALGGIPVHPFEGFRVEVLRSVEAGERISAYFGTPLPDGSVRLTAVLADAGRGTLRVLLSDVRGGFDALTPDCPQAHLFEREILEQTGLVPRKHPWLKPVRLPGNQEFFSVEGEGIHEVAVGPVHAGIIEPGHFRFQCEGERVLHLEIALGYQHRGAERALQEGPGKRVLPIVETLAGDATIGHAMAFAQILEALSGIRVPARAQAIRGIALELERMANHTGDLGALAGDVGYLPTASYCGRLRGDFLNLTALLCGNRFGRGVIRPGGVGFDLEAPRAERMSECLDRAVSDLENAVDLLWKTPSVMARFEETGPLSEKTCRDLGLVGPAARACGADLDVRRDFPAGIFRFTQIPVSTWPTGDVFARAYVRWLEIQRSAVFLLDQLQSLPQGPLDCAPAPLLPGRLAVSLVEGWRGVICHVALTDAQGRFLRYKVVDPSFHNWMGLAVAVRDQAISDFPLVNKSFNLSYCGHDL